MALRGVEPRSSPRQGDVLAVGLQGLVFFSVRNV